MSRTVDFKNKFGADYVNYHGLLVLRRSKALEYREQQRLKWRLDKILVDSKHIFCVTFDDLYSDLENHLKIHLNAYLSGALLNTPIKSFSVFEKIYAWVKR
ncbi:MAG: hypothetical protein GY749_15055 [Desulfobacteraceae bacterium]|nr:hypothetical protein [Desulfobacteraceae bacterium]